MDTPETPSQPEPSPAQLEPFHPRPAMFPTAALQELEQKFQDLRTLFTAGLVALLVLSCSLNLFLAKQMRQVRTKVTESRPIVARVQAEFQRKEPRMKDFINALQSYSASNRDFQPVIDRYRTVLSSYLVRPMAVSTTPTGIVVPRTAPGTPTPAPAPAPGAK